jgi:hypothetical protein
MFVASTLDCCFIVRLAPFCVLRADFLPPVYLPGSEPGRLGIMRRKLLAFLDLSQHYHTEKMLSRFPQHVLLQERAILLSRIGRHAQVLDLYAHRLHDPGQALRYCNTVYNEKVEEASSVYLYLLQVLLQPSHAEAVHPDSRADATMSQSASVSNDSNGTDRASGGGVDHVAVSDAVFQLLAQYHDRIDPHKALALLPPTVPVALLQPYLEAVLCRNVQSHRSAQVRIAAGLKADICAD